VLQLPTTDRLPAPQDSVLVESPLPGGIAAFLRFLFGVPQWVQIGGAILGAAVAVAIVVHLWRRRHAIGRWLVARPREVKIGLAVGALVVVLVAASAGRVSWNYMQHDNGFCTGCHVMGEAYERFTASEHDTLSCHDCHQQSIFASTRQLYLWVLERPMDIDEHSKVPNARCESCHVTGQAEVWQRIASTAGHRTHLESDSSALRDIQCVTCHGLEVHSFVPVDSTCAQANCHINQRIGLGPMAEQTSMHCANCHEFTTEVPLLATRDSAAGTLVPRRAQCFSCHEMQQVLAEFDVTRDPHGGTCGMCHNPHQQETAQEAGQTCATAACHGDWRAEPFHVGANHGRVGTECLMCHAPHRAAVDASDCQSCHESVVGRDDIPRAVRDRLRRALPFDTSAAARRIGFGLGFGVAPWPMARDAPYQPPPDSFPHDRHTMLACTTCHTTLDGTQGLVFAVPRGCQLCHHQEGRAAECRRCHVSGPDTPQTTHVTVAVRDRGPATRPVTFRHAAHAATPCASCHATGAALAVSDDVRACRDCHDDHHTARRDCATCHAMPDTAAHEPPSVGHVACDACHASSTVQRLVPDRAFCATCHEPQQAGHFDDRECTICHMLASPDQWRRHLTRAP
jgi:hypothetical protein